MLVLDQGPAVRPLLKMLEAEVSMQPAVFSIVEDSKHSQRAWDAYKVVNNSQQMRTDDVQMHVTIH